MVWLSGRCAAATVTVQRGAASAASVKSCGPQGSARYDLIMLTAFWGAPCTACCRTPWAQERSPASSASACANASAGYLAATVAASCLAHVASTDINCLNALNTPSGASAAATTSALLVQSRCSVA